MLTYTSSVTQKGQATIPLAVRRKLNLKSGDKVSFVVEGEEVKLVPSKSFFDYRGSVKSDKPFDVASMKQAVHDQAVERYEDTRR